MAMKLCQKIRHLMIDRGISSLDELAKATRISKTTLWEMVKGTERGCNPQIFTCKRLAQYFDVPLGVLVDDEIDLAENPNREERPVVVLRPASARGKDLGIRLPEGVPIVEVEIPDEHAGTPSPALGAALLKIESELAELRNRLEEIVTPRAASL
jgi:transcriptional regulator with XRE-family HTH domain